MNDKIRKDLETLGITGVKNIHYNPSYEELFKMEMNPSLTGYDKGQLTELDAINVMTGIYTGRSPKDKYIVMDECTSGALVRSKTSPRSSSVARNSLWSTLSAAPTKTPA